MAQTGRWYQVMSDGSHKSTLNYAAEGMIAPLHAPTTHTGSDKAELGQIWCRQASCGSMLAPGRLHVQVRVHVRWSSGALASMRGSQTWHGVCQQLGCKLPSSGQVLSRLGLQVEESA